MLSDNLKNLLEKGEMNESELARKAGVPQSRVNEIIAGKTKNPWFKTVCSIADALGVSVDELRGINTNKGGESWMNEHAKSLEFIRKHDRITYLGIVSSIVEAEKRILQGGQLRNGKNSATKAVTRMREYAKKRIKVKIRSEQDIQRRIACGRYLLAPYHRRGGEI